MKNRETQISYPMISFWTYYSTTERPPDVPLSRLGGCVQMNEASFALSSIIFWIMNTSTIMSSSGIRTNENDVLLGRGGNNHSHCGNEQLRRIAHGRVGEYVVARKKQKAVISRWGMSRTFLAEDTTEADTSPSFKTNPPSNTKPGATWTLPIVQLLNVRVGSSEGCRRAWESLSSKLLNIRKSEYCIGWNNCLTVLLYFTGSSGCRGNREWKGMRRMNLPLHHFKRLSNNVCDVVSQRMISHLTCRQQCRKMSPCHTY